MESIRREILWEILNDSSSSDDGEEILQILEESSSSSDDSTEEQEKHASIENFMSVVDAYSDTDFKTHFRLERSTIENLIIDYAQSGFPPTTRHGGNPKIGARKEVYMFVWYVSNTITFRQLGNLFGHPKSSAWIAVQRVSDWFVTISRNYIKWPLGDDVNRNCRKFESRSRIPGVIAAIDCTHIGINAPHFDKECYYNRKHSFTIVLQAVVDAEKKFVDICCGEPGSLHDSRVLRRSPLFDKAYTYSSQLFPNRTYIIGDSAYPSLSWLVPPFRDNGRLTDQQKSFNYLHSRTRIVVENAFGLLKGRFRRLLKFTEQRNLQSVKKIVLSACVLHNICISVNDEYNEFEEEEDQDEETVPENTGSNETSTNRREDLFRLLVEKRII